MRDSSLARTEESTVMSNILSPTARYNSLLLLTDLNSGCLSTGVKKEVPTNQKENFNK